MRKTAGQVLALILATLFSAGVSAQSIVLSGNVENKSSLEKVSAVSVTIKGTNIGTFTDDKGNFEIRTAQKLPLTLVFTSVGFKTQEVVVSSASTPISVNFKPSDDLGQEVVVSAQRVPQRIMESPVSIERVSAATIRNSSATSFYDILSSIKGVDVTTSSLTFKTPSTRGFVGSGNVRFNQLVDGMDNQSPGLNFSVGAIIGLSELDVDNLELLSGASSALYGPGGMNGTLLMNSKSPFKYQGLSFLVKTGVMNVDRSQRPNITPYHNWNLRWAKKVSEKFAFKINSELIQAKDWAGVDERNYNRIGTNGAVIYGNRQTDPNYDGINVYGDETNLNFNESLPALGGASFWQAIKSNIPLTSVQNYIDQQLINNPAYANGFWVSRTGYKETDIINPNTVNFKLSGAMHYKVNRNLEAILAAYWGTGNTVYTGSDRYTFKDFVMAQYKFELNHKNWMLRAYTTQEDAGESFNSTVTVRRFNETWKSSPQWFQEYGLAYLGAIMAGTPSLQAHNIARATADNGRPAADSKAFKEGFDKLRKISLRDGGGLLIEKSDLYNVEGNYNFSSVTKSVADILVGGNFKRYVLNSEGTVFADSAGTIGINEYGAYVQASRKLNSRFNLTLAGRYDKNQNFKGRFTPRATLVFKIKDNNNIRLSYQSAYRFPTTQQQWINLDVGKNTRLIGGQPSLRQFFHFDTNPVYTLESVKDGSNVLADFPAYKPEYINSFELGYKGLLLDNKMLIDVYGYYGIYNDFITRRLVVRSKTGGTPVQADSTAGELFSVPVNVSDAVTTYGFGLSVDYKLPANFVVSANVSSDVLEDVPANYTAYFNAPKYRINASFGNTGFGYNKRFGFNVSYKWQDAFYFQGDFANGNLPEIQTVDAHVSYKLPLTKSILKVGANNVFNQYYYNGIGNSQIGGLYYVSFGYNLY